MDLTDRPALVTGGGTGLGRAISMALAAAGAKVAIGYSRSADDAQATVAAIEDAGGRAVAIRADLAEWDAAAALVDAAEAAIGPLDVLVNNAALTRYVPFRDLSDVTEGDWDIVFDVNLRAMFAVAQAVAPRMVARGGGRILNVASNSGITAEGSSLPYVVSKTAVIGLTHALARALAPTVLVNGIAPGWMETRWLDMYIPESRRAKIAASPVPPVPVEDVAAAAVMLIRNDAINAEILVVDRGERWHPEPAPS